MNLQISDVNKKIIEIQNRVNKQQQDSEKLIINNIDNSTVIDKIANISTDINQD